MIKDLNQYIDQTLLKADATLAEVDNLIREAKDYQFKAICVNPCFTKYSAEALKNSGVSVCTVVGFPLGANATATKVFETKQAIIDGANEIDVVLNVGALKYQQESLVLAELKQIRNECSNGVILKVIIETTLLSEAEKIIACKLVSAAKADFIKTSTGFAKSGATIEDVRLLKAYVDPNVAIKASGGIKTQEQALALINAGAKRLGTSNGVAIMSKQKAKNEY